jgi:Spy/CpxP family protein refolding chaperone
MSNSRNRNLLIIIGVLFLTNIAVLVYFLGQKKPAKPEHGDRDRPGITESLQKEVGFTDEQIAQYKQLKELQKQSIRPMYDEMRMAKDSLFRLLTDPQAGDSILNQVSEVIAQKQKALDLQTFNYFKKIRTLCTPEQQPRYDSVIQRMFRKMGKPSKGNDAEKKQIK